MLSLTGYSQVDSLRVVGVRAWQLSRLIDETKLSRVCDSTLQEYVKVLDLSQKTRAASDSLTNEIRLSRDLHKANSLAKDTIIQKTEQVGVLKEKQARNRGRKEAFGLSGILAIVLVLIL